MAAKIPGGYILLARKIIDSEIWDKPPLYLKIWIYLLTRAQHSEHKGLKKGQLSTSIPEIIKNCSWSIGRRKEYPTKDQVFQVLDWMRKESNLILDHSSMKAMDKPTAKATAKAMIKTMKATHSILVEVQNYCVYQNPKLYESNAKVYESNGESNGESNDQPDNTNKNDLNKNDKNGNIPFREIVDQFNFICTSLPKVVQITKTRTTALNREWKQHNTLEWYIQLFERVEKSDLLSGRKGEWKASFDWIFKPANLVKIIEGNYDKNNSKQNNEREIRRKMAMELDRRNGIQSSGNGKSQLLFIQS